MSKEELKRKSILYQLCMRKIELMKRSDHNTKFVYVPIGDKYNPNSVSCG